MDLRQIRRDFPILQTEQHGRPLVYLDNAATLQMPEPVLSAITEHYRTCNANVHRGVHSLSQKSTDRLEQARSRVTEFLGAEESEIVFTAGTTDSLNQLSRMLRERVRPGQQIIVSAMEHHSNLIPWQELAREKGAVLSILPLDDRGELDLYALEQLLKQDTALVAVAWCSNVLGTVNPIGEIAWLSHEAGALCVVDGAQGMKLGKTDVKKLDCDFLAFSGHKLGALTGTGVLYGKRALFHSLPPAAYGGGMVDQVTGRTATFGQAPQRFEAGTPNYVGAISLGTAMEYLGSIGLEEIARQEENLIGLLTERLSDFPGLHILGEPRRRSGAVSFYADGVHPFDLGVMLDSLGFAVRTGHMCAQPLVERFGIKHVVRVSPAFYNTEEEIDQFADAVGRILLILRRNGI